MQRLKAFFYVIYKSATSLEYYKEVLSAKMSFSIKYFVSLAILLSLVTTITISVSAIPAANKIFDETLSAAQQLFPDNLEIDFENNKWTINQPEPYIIKFPMTKSNNNPESSSEVENEKIPQNLIVFSHNGTIEDLETMNTLILVNAKNVLTKDNNGFRAYPIENIHGKVTKKDYIDLLGRLGGLKKYLTPIVILASFLISVVYYYIAKSIYILFASTFILIIGWLTFRDFDYGRSVRLTIHSMTLPVIVEMVTRSLNINIGLPAWYLVANTFIATAALWWIKKNSVDKKGEIDPTAAQTQR